MRGDIARDLRGSHNVSVEIFDRRDREGDIDERTILAARVKRPAEAAPRQILISQRVYSAAEDGLCPGPWEELT